MGTGGAAFSIRRTSIGPFGVNEASSAIDEIGSIFSMTEILRGTDNIVLDEDQKLTISHGGSLNDNRKGTIALIDKSGNLLAVAEGDGQLLRPICVFPEEQNR